QTQRASLTRGAATGDAGGEVVAAEQVEHLEGVVDQLLVQLVREVLLESAAVDGRLAVAGNQSHAGDGLLAAADGRAGDVENRARGRGSRLGGRLGAEALGSLVDGVCDVRHGNPCVPIRRAYWATWSRVYVVGCW